MNHPPLPAKFHIMKMLGRGGTAAVFQIFSEAHKQELAWKCPLNDDGESLTAFTQLAQREHHLIGKLKFPGIVRILEVALDQPAYLLMELCRGPTLDQCGKIDNIAVALNLISAIALSLEYLRVHSIIHGDLKPHNIFLPEHWFALDGNQLFYVKLSDFSLGRLGCEPETDRIGVGTVGYMAPETIAESQSSFQSDLFSLGVIAYQLLTGVHPFMDKENDPVKINSRIREEEPIPIQTLRPDTSPGLVELIDSLLAKKESDRPQSGWEVCQVLNKLGAQYPYKKALRPSHFFLRDSNSFESLKSVLQLSEMQSRRLDLLTQNDASLFRLTLTANFLKGGLHYDGQHFVFSKEVYWPLALRRRTLRIYQQLPACLKKSVVKAALVGGKDDARKLGITKDNELTNVPEASIELIRQFVTPRVVKKYSAIYAAKAEQRSLHELAARLYVQAGNLEGAERCAFQAAYELNKEHLKDRALRILNHVTEFARMAGQLAEVRQLLMIKADTYKENGEADCALATYHQIIDLYRTIPPDKLLAETYKDLGDLYRMKQDIAEGLQALNHALDIYRNLNDELEISHTLNNIGNIYWIASDFDTALIQYRKSLRIKRRLKAIADVVTTLGNIAMIYGVKGRLKRSIRIMELCLSLNKERGDTRSIARTLNNLGYVYYYSGDLPKAVCCLRESLDLNRRIGNKKEIMFNLENLTGVMTTAGHLKEVLPLLREGISLSERLMDNRHMAAFNLNIGTVHKRMGQFSAADRYYEIGERIVHDIGDRMLQVDAKVRRASLRYFLGDTFEARRLAEEAYQEAEKINDKSARLNALLLITKVSSEPHFIEIAFHLADELHLHRERMLITVNLIESLLEQERQQDALVQAESFITQLDNIAEDIELAWMCNIAAELMITRGEYVSALTFLNRAYRSATETGLMPELITTLTLRGKVDFLNGKFENCYQRYKSALQICRKIADNITNQTDRKLFENRRSVVFLLNEIKRLGKLMGQKKDRAFATVDPAQLQS